jgi:phosphomethylpyrimidine synthase
MIKLNDDLLDKISKIENVKKDYLKEGIRKGHIVITKNDKRSFSKPCAVGKGLSTKVNANFGLSPGNSSITNELKKMETAIKAGADAVMDLSTGPLLGKLRRKVLKESSVPVGTVPIYELACKPGRSFYSLSDDDFIDVLTKQAEEGVDFFTIHSGITIDAVRYVETDPRIMNIVSRGGALLASWMVKNNRENPFFTRYEDILKIAKKYNITLSLGDSLRPGSIADGTDSLQIGELLVLGQLQKRAHQAGVQVMIEGPGHVQLDQIETNIRLEKSLCNGAPFYVLGPLVTDAAPGYDHIVSAIGGAIAAWHGADFLCYVTPAEHVRLPEIDDVKQGVIASKIAAHAADIAKGIPSAMDRDIKISLARSKRDWKKQFLTAIDPELPDKMRKTAKPVYEDVCTMCGEFCSVKLTEQIILDKRKQKGIRKRAV